MRLCVPVSVSVSVPVCRVRLRVCVSMFSAQANQHMCAHCVSIARLPPATYLSCIYRNRSYRIDKKNARALYNYRYLFVLHVQI